MAEGYFLRIDNGALTQLLTGHDGPVGQDLVRRTMKVHAGAVVRCPVDTGALRSSLRWIIGSDAHGLVGLVGSDKIYAQWASDHAKDPDKRDYLINALQEAQ